MRRFRCTVSYVGNAYDGWQSQRNGRSVQEQIEEVLHAIAHTKINITASGRTDAGVSARAQVFHFDSDMDLSARKWMGALNGRLPKDIHIMDIEETDQLFHARYNVRMKQYAYRVNLGPYDVFTKDTAYQCPVKLDTGKMEQASKYLIGTHDFTSFNSNPLSETPDQVRTVTDIVFEKNGNILTMYFTGKGFLRYMVRMMSAALIEVGKGKMEPEGVKRMLDARSKTIARKNAPANGLTLEWVDYFEVCALNEQAMIREFLAMDEKMPAPLTKLEGDVKEAAWPRIYAMTTRSSQQLLGVFRALSKAQGCVLEVFDENDLPKAQSLREQLTEWLRKNGTDEDAALEIRMADRNENSWFFTENG